MELSSIENIQKAYELLDEQEETISKQLQVLLSRQYHLESKLKNISESIPKLKAASTDAEKLAKIVEITSALAENVSEKVKRLDTTRSRVSECQQRVQDLLDLQLCSEGVQTALKNEDYEKAAGHIHRFLSIDQKVLKQTASDVAQDDSSVDNSFTILEEVAEKLRRVVAKKFKEALADQDLASIERFFKIYPLLNMHEEGIKEYSLFLTSKLRATSEKNLQMALDGARMDRKPNVIFADTMTLLLEGTARVIETHQPLVDTYYGPDKMVTFMSYLQEECDRQGNRIVAELIEYRGLKKKIKQIEEYQNNVRITDKFDPKSLDVLLGELTLLHYKVELYFKFVRRRIVTESDEASQKRLKEIERLIKQCELSRTMQEIMKCYYVVLEMYFTEESVYKAVAVDSLIEDCNVSSMVDDVFFIIRKSIRRACTSGSINAVCTVISNVCLLLKTRFCSVLKRQLEQGYLDYPLSYNAFQQYRLQATEQDVKSKLFLTYLNNADMSLEYIDTLKSSLSDEIGHSYPNLGEEEKENVNISLSELVSVKTNSVFPVIDYGMRELRESAIKPRLSSWFSPFFEISHRLTEEEFSNYEANEPFIQKLIAKIDEFLSSFKESLTPSNYDTLVNVLTSEVTRHFEKVVAKAKFNRLGGLVFDKELRALVSFLTSATSWSVRDKFTRLVQISTLLNLDRLSEMSEIASGLDKLQPSEIKKVLSLRTDLSEAEIANLKL
ncbi:UNVERIFIED_CONTAM: hypothetical protein PYX00_003462 [Menopon gallinae]|uniref:Conserved oligomeric Golgi complex subunit 4 n=1 Tax=Menopon gallinae TaxID=328185 RepID=A0AAW2I0J3_9NEOP